MRVLKRFFPGRRNAGEGFTPSRLRILEKAVVPDFVSVSGRAG
jgi:hypothetical protein